MRAYLKLLSALGAVVLCTSAAAQGTSNFSIPAGPLADALNDLAQQSGLQVLFPSNLVAHVQSVEVRGPLTVEDALRRLLANTGLRFEFVNPHTVTILAPPSPQPRSSEPSGAAAGSGAAGGGAPTSSPSGENMGLHRNALVRFLGLFAVCGSTMHGGAACGQAADAAASGGVAADTESLATITVSARKRDESLATVPVSITVFTGDALESYNIQSFADYATKTPNVSFSYGGGPTGIADARTVAVRGITGQNLYGTAGATGFYIDDTPVPGSVDPRVLDIDNIEILKGPQGTLFGESSLGGNVRLITRKPSVDRDELSYMVQAGMTSGGGSADGGGNVIGNLVLVPDELAVRTVLFFNHDAGYLTRTFPDPSSPAVDDPYLAVPRTSVGNQGAQSTFGGSLATLLKATDDFAATLRVMFQNTTDHGFPAAFAPLPEFTPDYTLNRAYDVQPRASDVWVLPSLDLKYTGQGWSFVSSSSFFYRHTQDIEDSTYGTQQVLTNYYAVSNLPSQPFLWDGEHFHDQMTEEMRVSFDPVHNLSGTVGVFYSRTHTKFYIPPTYANGLTSAVVTPAGGTPVAAWPNDEIWTQTNPAFQKDISIFGELYYKFLDRFTLTAGARRYWLAQDTDFTADGFMNGGATPSDPQQNRQSGTDPKVGISYQATDEAMVYASASKGFRAGGAQADVTFCSAPGLPESDITHLKSDTLWSYEVGSKIQLPHPGLLLSAAAFHIDWKNLQQQVALPCGFYFDVNGGEATINGAELELAGHVSPALQVRFGAGYEKTKITDPGALGLPGIGLESGSRILGTPAWTVSAGAVYTQPLTQSLDGFVSADYSFTGDSVSLLNGGYGAEATRPSYSLVNARVGVDHGKTELSLNVHNLTNAKPNLGDIGYVGYAQYQNYAAGAITPQVATLQPLTVLIQFKQSF
jgi:outer membrane receptor protein involved in Fe transport